VEYKSTKDKNKNKLITDGRKKTTDRVTERNTEREKNKEKDRKRKAERRN
jgi:hypothetical protein